MNKLLPLFDSGQVVAYMFDCAGCGLSHAPYARPHKSSNGASWEFNGDLEYPTFSPSVLVKVESPYTGKQLVCHFFINNGFQQFLGDCTHSLKNQIVEMENVESGRRLFETLEEQIVDLHRRGN